MAVGEVHLVKGLVAGSSHGPCWGDGSICGWWGQTRLWPTVCREPGNYSCCLKILQVCETYKIFPLRWGVMRAPPARVASAGEGENQAQWKKIYVLKKKIEDSLRRRKKMKRLVRKKTTLR